MQNTATVTVEQLKAAGHPSPERGARRRFLTTQDRDAWLAGLRASEARQRASEIAHRHGEAI